MLVSIVSGTFNRQSLLKQMIQSIRDQLLPGITYEFVINDGGSTDGTLDWLRQQADVTLIEDGELKGAISAFSRAAEIARGDYVLLANDDVTFMPNSILTGIGYLETHPDCGAVAFEDNRIKGGTQYIVQSHATRQTADSPPTGTPYAQLALVRKWLGDAAGWWGYRDPIMSQSRTYGGDNYLSARIWELGYTVDAVKGCRAHDYVALDGLRQVNNGTAENDSRVYYERYPNGAVFGAVPVDIPEPEERLRILYLPIHEARFMASRQQKRGLRDALSELGIVVEYDYILRELDGANIHQEAVALARALKPDILYMQVHQATRTLTDIVRQIRAEHPNVLVINWNGDYWVDKYMHPDTLAYMQYVDISLVVNASIIEQYAAHGIYAAYVQDASEEPDTLPDAPAYDVLFLGSRYSGSRTRLGELLSELPYSVGIYGQGWGGLEAGNTYYQFDVTHALIQNAKIVIGDMQFPDAEAYVSNRFFNTLYAGGFHLQQHIPNFTQHTGFVPGKHYAEWTDLEDLRNQIEYWLSHDAERVKIAKAGKAYARRWHTYKARVKEVFTKVIPAWVEATQLEPA